MSPSQSEAESNPSSPLRVKTTFMPSGDEALRLKATSRFPGRDDKSAQFNRIWYEMRLAEKLAESVKSNQAKQFR